MNTDTPRVLSSSTLVGDEVKNDSGERLGEVEDLMLDLETGRIRYAVMSCGGFLGMNKKLLAIPWSSLRVDRKNECVRLDISRQTLENAPGFADDDWPDFSDPALGRTVYSYYGQPTYW